MRFEIGPNGGFVIFVGLLALLCSVFILGMIAERQMTQGQGDQGQLASVYPMPAGEPSALPARATAPNAVVVAAVSKPSPRDAAASKHVRLAVVTKPRHDHVASPHHASASLSPAHRSTKTRSNGYKIMIDTAMDQVAADRMASRLTSLGYSARTVPSQMNGQTWYRVQVGPYPSASAAGAAQEKLQAAYTARYINRVGASSSGSTNAGMSDSHASVKN